MLSWGVCCVRLCCQTMNMCRLLLDGFHVLTFAWGVSEIKPYQELVRLVFMVVPLLFAFVCNFGLLAFYSKFVTTLPTGLAGRNLTHGVNPVSVVISTFTR